MCSRLGFYVIVTVKQAFLLLGPQHTQSQLNSTPTDPALSYCRHQSAGHQANQMSPKPNLALAAEAANPEARNLSPARNPQPSNPARTRGSKVETSDLRLGRLLPALWILTRILRAGGAGRNSAQGPSALPEEAPLATPVTCHAMPLCHPHPRRTLRCKPRTLRRSPALSPAAQQDCLYQLSIHYQVNQAAFDDGADAMPCQTN